jgi:hypothetical protein
MPGGQAAERRILMLLTIIVIGLIILWLTGFFGPPVIPAIALPAMHIPWSDPVVHAALIVFAIIAVVVLLR